MRLRDALTAFADRGDRLRVILRRDKWNTSVTVLSAPSDLRNAQVRFHIDPNFHQGRKLAVLLTPAVSASSLHSVIRIVSSNPMKEKHRCPWLQEAPFWTSTTS